MFGKLKRSGKGPARKRVSENGPFQSDGHAKTSQNLQNNQHGPNVARVIIKQDTPMLWMYLGKKKVYALVDSGADISLISRETFDKIAAKNKFEFSTKDCVPLQTAAGQRIKNFGTVKLEVKLSGFNKMYKFQIVDNLKNQVLLGNDFLSDFGAQLDFGQKTLNIEGYVIPLRPQKLTCASVTSLIRTTRKVTIPAQSYAEIPGQINRKQLIEQECTVQPLSNAPILGEEPGLCVVESVGKVHQNRRIPVCIVNATGRDYTIPAYSVIGLAEVIEDPEASVSTVEEYIKSESTKEAMEEEVSENSADDIPETKKAKLSHVPEAQRQKIVDLLEKNADLFAKNDCELGKTHLVTCKIDTGDHPPIKQNPYRLPYSQRQLVEEHVQKMLEAGVIEPSQSPWASPIVIVDKKDGSKRFCVDYRALNKVAVQNSHPLPRIDDILASLNGAKYFTCLDLRSGYWQIPMDPASREKTAFTCFLGLFSWSVMPFGYHGAPALFSELMNKVLQGIQHKFTISYLDDLLIYSKTWDEHMEHIQVVFDRLREAGLKLKMSKCDFLKQEVNYLGHVVSASGVKPDPEKIRAIKELAPPKNVKETRSLLGLCGWYRRFIDGYAKITRPLTELTKKNRPFIWTEECQKAFEKLQCALTEAPILAFPDVNKPYKLYTDASNGAIGAALVQESALGERVIQYLSHQLNETQQRWPIIEKEAYAIVYSVQKFRPYLLGSKFTVMTDHKPLKYLFSSKFANAKIQRWAILLAEYGCDICFLKGSENRVADSLSRLPCLGPGAGESREEKMTSESSTRGPTNYVCQKQEGNGQNRTKSSRVLSECECHVNVIDSDRAPKVQVRADKEECGETEERSKEKFREFLEEHRDFRTIQSEDREIKSIMEILGNQDHPNHADISRYYCVEDGLLYRVSEPTKCDNYVGLQLVIPKFLQKPLIDEIHSGYFGGHLGIDKTYDKLRSRYYWSGMYRDVVQFLKGCVACNMRKLKRQRPPLQEMQVAKYPFEQIAIDTAGPFPESYSGNRYIINIIDLFSGWPESFATSSKSAETVAQILIEQIIPRHSCPRVIVSDNGTEFCNAVIDQLSAFFNIKHIRTSVYHPQSNGKVERFNRVMNDSLAKLVDSTQRDWDTKIPGVLSAYRTAKHESTKYSPFFTLFGRDPILPCDSLLAPKFRYQGEEYLPTMLENLHRAHHHIRHNLERSHERNREYYDRKAKPVNIKVGDAVYFRDPTEAATQSSKLSSQWKPFYRVIKALSDVTFVIKNQLSGGTKVVNAHNLRLADTNDFWKATTEEPTSINHKYENRQKSFIPTRVQPPRRSKLSAIEEENLPDYESESDTESVSGPIRPSAVTEPPEPSSSDPHPTELPLPASDSDTDAEDVPLADIQKRLRKRQISESEDEMPLSELAKRLKEEKPEEPEVQTRSSVKRRLPSESDSLPLPDVETAPPPEQYIIRDQSDLESDIPEMEDLTAGACVKTMSSCVKPVSPCAKSESPVEESVTTNPIISKTSLLSQLMTMQARNQSLMERMMMQLEKM